jgi:hypothetical protein
MFTISADTDAAEKLVAMMQERVKQFAAVEMPQAFVEWQSDDMNRSRPSVEQPSSDTVETTIRNPPQAGDRWNWWEDQEREPRGIPEGGEFMSFPAGHWRNRRRRRAVRRGEKGFAATIRRRIRGAAIRRLRRIVTPARVRRLRRMRRMAELPAGRLLERRVRRLAGVAPRGRGGAPRIARRVFGVRPVLRPQLGNRLAQRMTRSLVSRLRWR